MAEENRSKRTTFEDMVFTLFAFLLLGQMLNNLPGLLEERFGIVLGEGTDGVLVASATVGIDTPLGTRVSAPNGVSFYGAPGDEEDIAAGSFRPGASLVLKDGPVLDDEGNRWWYVENPETGEGGWVREYGLVREGGGGIDALTKLDTKARAMVAARLWESPEALIAVGAMKLGEWGTLADGPTTKNGTRWWFFDRDDSDEDGWVPESALTLYSEKGWHKSSPVVATRDTNLYERAGGGDVAGFLGMDGKARVVGGPTLVGGTYWWLVETEDGAQGWVPETALKDGGLRGLARSVVTTLVIIGTTVTVVLVGGIVYVTVRTGQVRAREAARIKAAVPKVMQPKRNERWDKVILHASSDNPNDWRLAVIEADIMLDEIITRMGYQGMTLGDRLKQITPGDMRTLDAAWEAHRVRNQIAHEGSDFILTQREAKRVIDLYGAVLEEFKYI